jgi:hypothetical protein
MRTYIHLTKSYWRIAFPLFISALAQGAVLAFVLGERVPAGFIVPAILMPWLVYFAITFVREPPPIMPATFGRVLLFVICWYAATCIFAILAAVCLPAATPFPSVFMAVPVWLCALLGWVGIPTLLRSSRVLRSAESAS